VSLYEQVKAGCLLRVVLEEAGHPIKRAGHHHKVRCPFHSPDNNPSCRLYDLGTPKERYTCFACGEKDTVIGMVMHLQGVSKWEAALWLAARLGIEVVPESEETRAQRQWRESACLFLAEVVELWQAHLVVDKQAVDYVRKRGVTEKVALAFQLGSTRGEDVYQKTLALYQRHGELPKQLGLIKPNKGRSPALSCMNRLVFPVLVPGGQVFGVSGRIWPWDANENRFRAKFWNSPASQLYEKGRLLYGLAHAHQTISRERRAVVVEGNFDVAACHSHGHGGTVAPLGTAFTADQLDLLRGPLRDDGVLIFAYDGDLPGRKATVASLRLCLGRGVVARAAKLPAGTDAGLLMASDDTRARFAQCLDASADVFDLLGRRWHRIAKDNLMDAVTEIRETAKMAKTKLLADMVLSAAASATGLDKGLLRKGAATPARFSCPTPSPPIPEPELDMVALARVSLDYVRSLEIFPRITVALQSKVAARMLASLEAAEPGALPSAAELTAGVSLPATTLQLIQSHLELFEQLKTPEQGLLAHLAKLEQSGETN
jgi:DNA primase